MLSIILDQPDKMSNGLRLGTYFELVTREGRQAYKTNGVLTGREDIFCFCLTNDIEVREIDQVVLYRLQPIGELIRADAITVPVSAYADVG